ncbi:PREDICTED: kininogen-2-like [Nanorana parkeri]|uniref:kininogen-2-like n=1 Tax=Nanorana parkeri TaxID=125878 RepID=UPI000853FD4E|nr:PREDICTED: kininogen-2-like [Nanorana parkeri]
MVVVVVVGGDSAAVPVPDIGVDCDDPNIFKAVDEALRYYNDAKEDGNQFLLFRVTDAKQRNDENGQIHYFLDYEIREGSCTVKSMHSWQDCQFQAHTPEQGKCSAHLLINTEKKIRTVVSQTCSVSKVPLEPYVTAVHHQCLGCPYPIDTNNEEVLRFVHIAIEKMNRQGSHLYYFDLDQIVNATRQVVGGWDYIINCVVRKTNCSKMDFKTKDSNECKLDKEGETGECELQVSETPDGQVNDIILKCTSQAGVCLNCPLNVDSDDAELQNLLSQVIDEYNSNINVTNLHKLNQVIKATKHGFQEQIYEVLFSMMPTVCSKPDHTILGDECNNLENASPLSCDTTIKVTDKRINVHSGPVCVEQQALIMRLSGLSPLRMSKKPDQAETNLQQHTKGKNKGQHKGRKQEQKGKSDKKRKHKHDDEDESSEEVDERGINVNMKEDSHQVLDLPSAQPTVPSKEAVPKDIEEKSNLELPYVPKCPGKLWQPRSLTTTVKTFTDDDLAFAAADFKPLPEKEEEPSKPYTPKQIPFFDDEDLLL